MKDDSIARIALIVVKVLKSLGLSAGEPKKCPVCDGKGYVPPDFYPQHVQVFSTLSITILPRCRACEGKGIVR